LYVAALLAYAAAIQVATVRREEADGTLDNLLVRRVGRSRWLAGRLLVGADLVAGAGVGIALGGWLGLGGSRPPLETMLQAGLNTTVPGLLVLGLGTLLYGLTPRLAAPVLYVLVLWSLLVEIVGTTLTDARWVRDSSVLAHLGPVPATPLSWSAVAWLLGLAALAAVGGLLAFTRRDLVGA
jgi:ABC-2 type transport system permease protein